MKKRWICAILALVMIVGLLPSVALRINAVEEMTISAEMVAVLKKMEGFNKYPVWDVSHYSIGYGTTCPDDMYEYYKENGITDEEAEELLKQHMNKHESNVNNFAAKYNLTLTQNQFDALVSFTYNCGAAWMKDLDGYFNTAVRSGDMGNALIYGMCLHSSAGGDYILMRRRLSEANMYINGVYEAYNDKNDGTYPDSYRYVFLNGNGGVVEYVIHGYDGADPVPVMTSFSSIPVGVDEAGNPFVYEFAGWYTEKSGGTKIELLDGTLDRGTILYAQWKDPSGQIVQLPEGDVLEPLEVTTTSSTNIRSGPATFYTKLGTLEKDTSVTITETYLFKKILWGKYEGGWISLSYTNYEEALANREAAKDDTWPKNGTVSGSNVNVRSGPGTSNSVAYQLNEGDSVTISEQYDDGELVWGKLEDGNWICVSYVVYDIAEEEEPAIIGLTLLSGPEDTEYVQMQDDLNFRGTVLVVTYSDGSISAMSGIRSMIETFSNAELGETTVVLEYEGYMVSFPVNIVKATVSFQNYDGTLLSSAQYAYGDTVQAPEVPPKPADEAGEYEFVGWDKEVTACAGDALYTAVFELIVEEPDETEPDETEPNETEPDETEPDETEPDETEPDETEPNETEPDETEPDETEPDETEPDDTTSEWPKTGTVTGTNVNVRVGPGTSYSKAGYRLNTGDVVVIYERVYDGTTYWWGRMEDGNWVCLDYVSFDTTQEPGTPEEPEEPEEPAYTPGDFDGSGIVDEDDAIYLLRYVFFPENYPIAIPADYDGNGTVNEDDAIYLLRYVFFPENYPLIKTDE